MKISSAGRKQKWWELSLALHAGFMILIVEIWMRKFGFKRCQQGLTLLADRLPNRSENSDLGRAQQIALLVETGNKRYSPYMADCLTRSLVLQYILKRRNIESKLCLGVRMLTGQFEAHAWVEYDDIPLNEPEFVRQIYTAFDWDHKRQSSLNS